LQYTRRPSANNPYAQMAANYEPPSEYTESGAFLSGAADMFSFGFGDELSGVFGGQEAVRRSRERQQAYQAMHPGWYLGGQLAGGFVGGGVAGAGARLGLRALGATAGAARMAQNVGIGGRIAAGAATGGAGGALYGAGSGYDGDRLRSAGEGVIPGVLGGAGGQVAGEVLGAGVRALGRSAGPEANAATMIANAQRRFGQVGNNLERDLADAPQGSMLMDVIPGGPQLVQGASARPSGELPAMEAALRTRNQNMAQETVQDLWQSLTGGERGSAAASIRQLAATRRAQSEPLYARAFANPVNPRRAEDMLGEVIRRNPRLFQAAERDAQELMLSEHGTVFNRDDGRFWHYLQIGADQVYERLRNAQGGLSANERRVFGGALDQYRTGLRRLLGQDFRQAQAVWSNSVRQGAAVRRGYEAATPQANDLDLGDLEDEMRRMTRGELEHMRLGAVTRLSDMIENAQGTAGRSNPVRAVLRSEGQRRVLQRLFGGSENLEMVVRRIEQRQQLFDNSVQSGIGVNSHTANRLAARESQVAQTNPLRGGGLWERLTSSAADQWDENVSNQLLRELRTPANEALGQIRAAGGVEQWSRGRGLLAAAQRQALERESFRRRALASAFTSNMFLGSGGAQLSGGSQ
jgi:hypothetical protein